VLAELLGSFVVGPADSAATGPPCAAPQATQQQGQQPRVTGSAKPGARRRAGVGAGAGVCVDLMSSRVSYPQFLELLLVCAALRCSGLLDLTAKAAPPLELGPELQVRGSGGQGVSVKTAIAECCSTHSTPPLAAHDARRDRAGRRGCPLTAVGLRAHQVQLCAGACNNGGGPG
jgi:hypothetical protein